MVTDLAVLLLHFLGHKGGGVLLDLYLSFSFLLILIEGGGRYLVQLKKSYKIEITNPIEVSDVW